MPMSGSQNLKEFELRVNSPHHSEKTFALRIRLFKPAKSYRDMSAS